MPYFSPTTNTPISSSVYDTNVRDQLVSQFASVSARDSAITAPVNGMFCYTTDTGSLWRYNGTKWLLEPWVVEKTADQSWTSNTTLSNVTDLTRTVEANCHYWFEFALGVIGTSTNGLQTAVNVPASGRLDFGYVGVAYNSGSIADAWVQNGASGAGSGVFGQGSGNLSQARISGVLATAGTSGSLTIQAAQQVSGASSSWVLRASTLTVRQLS